MGLVNERKNYFPAGSAGHGTTTAAQAATNVVNARALENGMLCIMLIPMAIKFILYFALYYTLKKDRLAAGKLLYQFAQKIFLENTESKSTARTVTANRYLSLISFARQLSVKVADCALLYFYIDFLAHLWNLVSCCGMVFRPWLALLVNPKSLDHNQRQGLRKSPASLCKGEDNQMLLVELTKKDSERGSEGGEPELPEASGAASGKLPAGAVAERPQLLSLNARARSVPERPASAELRPRGPNRQQGAPVQAQAIEGRAQSLADSRAQSLNAKARGSIDSVDRFLDLELSLPPIPSPRTAANTQPHA